MTTYRTFPVLVNSERREHEKNARLAVSALVDSVGYISRCPALAAALGPAEKLLLFVARRADAVLPPEPPTRRRTRAGTEGAAA
jgi:hypothetical protein